MKYVEIQLELELELEEIPKKEEIKEESKEKRGIIEDIYEEFDITFLFK